MWNLGNGIEYSSPIYLHRTYNNHDTVRRDPHIQSCVFAFARNGSLTPIVGELLGRRSLDPELIVSTNLLACFRNEELLVVMPRNAPKTR